MIIFLIPSVLACSKYTCTYEALEKGQCYYKKNDITYLKPCEDSYYSKCDLTSSKGICEAQSPQKTNRLVGEKCYKNQDCEVNYSQGCADGVCKGLGEFGECSSSLSCNPGYFCSNHQCVKQIKVNEYGCINNYECVNNGVCDGGFCVACQSKMPGEEVLSCSGGLNYACMYYLCISDYFGKSYCIDKVVSRSKLPMKCENDLDCFSQADLIFGQVSYSKCECSYNKNGEKYCGLFNGDEIYSDLLKALQKWRSSSGIQNCNTLLRDSYRCVMDWMDHKEATKLMYYWETVKRYSSIQDIEYCVRKMLFEDYFDLKDEFDYLNK